MFTFDFTKLDLKLKWLRAVNPTSVVRYDNRSDFDSGSDKIRYN